jgi:hypothetical protein
MKNKKPCGFRDPEPHQISDLVKLRTEELNGEKCALAATLTQNKTVKDHIVY